MSGAAAGGGGSAGVASMWARALIGTLVAHVAAAAGAGVWVVARYWSPPEAVFEAKAPVRIPPRQMEQRLAAAEYEAAASRPMLDDRLASVRPTEFALPDLAEAAVGTELDVNALVASVTEASLEGMASWGSGLAGLGTGAGEKGGAGGGFDFFGIDEGGESVVVMVDVSGSMFLRLGDEAFDRVRREAIRMTEQLGINQRFGLVVWAGAAGSWKRGLVPATEGNRAEARRWMEQEINRDTFRRLDRVCEAVLREGPGGTRHDLALRQAFGLGSEVIFLISDGNALRDQAVIPREELIALTRQLQEERGGAVRLHSVYFMTGPDRKNERELLVELARRNEGTFRAFDAKEAGGGGGAEEGARSGKEVSGLGRETGWKRAGER